MERSEFHIGVDFSCGTELAFLFQLPHGNIRIQRPNLSIRTN